MVLSILIVKFILACTAVAASTID